MVSLIIPHLMDGARQCRVQVLVAGTAALRRFPDDDAVLDAETAAANVSATAAAANGAADTAATKLSETLRVEEGGARWVSQHRVQQHIHKVAAGLDCDHLR